MIRVCRRGHLLELRPGQVAPARCRVPLDWRVDRVAGTRATRAGQAAECGAEYWPGELVGSGTGERAPGGVFWLLAIVAWLVIVVHWVLENWL